MFFIYTLLRSRGDVEVTVAAGCVVGRKKGGDSDFFIKIQSQVGVNDKSGVTEFRQKLITA